MMRITFRNNKKKDHPLQEKASNNSEHSPKKCEQLSVFSIQSDITVCSSPVT